MPARGRIFLFAATLNPPGNPSTNIYYSTLSSKKARTLQNWGPCSSPDGLKWKDLNSNSHQPDPKGSYGYLTSLNLQFPVVGKDGRTKTRLAWQDWELFTGESCCISLPCPEFRLGWGWGGRWCVDPLWFWPVLGFTMINVAVSQIFQPHHC